MVNIEKCKITHYPDGVLAQVAKPIERIDDNIHQFVQKMTDIMRQHKGIGLAAPQVGVSLRLFIISLDGSAEKVRVYINPTVTPIAEKGSTSFQENEEGCLSVPGVYTKIRRYQKCTVTATNLQGNEFTEEADGLYARCLQHEYDHIEGMTIADRMTPTAKIRHRKQLKKLKEQHKKDETT